MDQICITPNCGRPVKSSRGLCKSCYISASRAIKSGKVPSWEFLEEQGLVLPSSYTRGQTSPFNVALQARLKSVGSKTAAQVIAQSHE